MKSYNLMYNGKSSVIMYSRSKQIYTGYFILAFFISACLFIPLSSNADTTQAAINNESVLPGLRLEPIQLLLKPTDLNPLIVSLGEKLFHDPVLGRDNDMACVSCHNLTTNGANHLAHTPGRNGFKLDVNTPTVFNSSLNHHQFWDGRAASLEEQINFVVHNDREFATNWPTIIKKFKSNPAYTDAFNRLYSDGLTADNIRNAIATFERSLITVNSRFDRYLLGETSAINKQEQNGYGLFKKYGCATCHQGSNAGGNLFMKIGLFGDYISERGNPTVADLGRYNITGKKRDRYVFRVPGLRLAALTPPYFHDGSIETLEEAVKVMAKHQLGRHIADQDINDIVAFLQTLPGEYKNQALVRPQQVLKESGKP